MRATAPMLQDVTVLEQLWRFECDRVFRDKLVSLEDKTKVMSALDEVSSSEGSFGNLST